MPGGGIGGCDGDRRAHPEAVRRLCSRSRAGGPVNPSLRGDRAGGVDVGASRSSGASSRLVVPSFGEDFDAASAAGPRRAPQAGRGAERRARRSHRRTSLRHRGRDELRSASRPCKRVTLRRGAVGSTRKVNRWPSPSQEAIRKARYLRAIAARMRACSRRVAGAEAPREAVGRRSRSPRPGSSERSGSSCDRP